MTAPGVALRVWLTGRSLGAMPLTGKGYQIRKFPDLDIASNTSTSVMAKTLFTAKDFRRMARTNLRDHETSVWHTRWGIGKEGPVEALHWGTAGMATETPYICSYLA